MRGNKLRGQITVAHASIKFCHVDQSSDVCIHPSLKGPICGISNKCNAKKLAGTGAVPKSRKTTAVHTKTKARPPPERTRPAFHPQKTAIRRKLRA